MTKKYAHLSVLLHEAISGLAIKKDGLYIDGTFGRGGHSRKILESLGADGKLIAIDRDPAAIEAATELEHDSRFQIVHGDFAHLDQIVNQMNLNGKVDGILLDLGVSSPQLDDPDRGFSFRQDGPLDMRMNNLKGQTAAQWLNTAAVDDIAWVIKNYGEERFAKKIARAVVQDREETPFTHTKQLADLIARLIPSKEKNKHPATRSFQAIRIHINGELLQIEQALEASLSVLKPGGRLSIISFHSLEDRIVKQFIRKHSQGPALPRGLPLMDTQIPNTQKLVACSKAIKPSAQEIETNPRSRSSVLRIAERLQI
jgi:16S rRNA (cytosine1402-N4)-methyltransferase